MQRSCLYQDSVAQHVSDQMQLMVQDRALQSMCCQLQCTDCIKTACLLVCKTRMSVFRGEIEFKHAHIANVARAAGAEADGGLRGTVVKPQARLADAAAWLHAHRRQNQPVARHLHGSNARFRQRRSLSLTQCAQLLASAQDFCPGFLLRASMAASCACAASQGAGGVPACT